MESAPKSHRDLISKGSRVAADSDCFARKTEIHCCGLLRKRLTDWQVSWDLESDRWNKMKPTRHTPSELKSEQVWPKGNWPKLREKGESHAFARSRQRCRQTGTNQYQKEEKPPLFKSYAQLPLQSFGESFGRLKSLHLKSPQCQSWLEGVSKAIRWSKCGLYHSPVCRQIRRQWNTNEPCLNVIPRAGGSQRSHDKTVVVLSWRNGSTLPWWVYVRLWLWSNHCYTM